jgi:hypothetical protein
MSKKRKPPLFYRSFHLTLGGIALLLPVFIWITDGSHSSSWPTKAWVILSVLLIAGVCIFLFGLLASDKRIDSTHIVAIPDTFLVAILAVPLYLVLRGIQRKKREQSSHREHDRVA